MQDAFQREIGVQAEGRPMQGAHPLLAPSASRIAAPDPLSRGHDDIPHGLYLGGKPGLVSRAPVRILEDFHK